MTHWSKATELQNPTRIELEQREEIATLTRERDEARAQALEEASNVADTEEEPTAGEMPPEIIGAVIGQDPVFIESALIGAVRATKKAISARIRALAVERRDG